ncbi:hypothetical protein F2Q69_00031699 [Brassica cretica]|uniref:BRX domain-containing protein n=1 Tax=Brassica cretica TaxID=69181 RepID=A0A8S9RYJ3_BRACR|nr:hypothetical protein F2Q69_00031699 [Brassica cretica]
MLTCIACSKQVNTNNGGSKDEEEDDDRTPRSKQAIKSLTSQIKDMAVKASGAYKSCKPCSGSLNRNSDAASASGRFHYAYKRPGISRSGSSTPKILGKDMESRLKGLLSGEGTPESVSGRTESTVFLEEEEEDEPKEWVAQVEPGVLITFVSLPEGGNDLKRIRFRSQGERKREMLTCIACSKQVNTNNGGSKDEEEDDDRTPRSKQTIKSLTSQIKDMAVKASGAYKSCKPCSVNSNRNSDAASASGRLHYAYKRPGISRSGSSTPKILGKEMESRLKGLLSGEGTPESVSGRTESTVFLEEEEEDEPKEWVAQVEPGVLITFVSLPEGGNDLKRIRFR